MMKTNRLNNLLAKESLAPLKQTSSLRVFDAPSGVQRPAPFDDSRASDRRIKSILVPLDGSAFAEQAIPVALGIAEQCGAVLHLVHVVVAVDVLDPYDALCFPDASLAALKRDRQSPIMRLLWPSCAEYLFRNSTRPLMFVPVEASS